jgi:hypothetical protein
LPAAARQIEIIKWRSHIKGTLVGFFSATMPSGMVFHSLMLHEKGAARWIAFPAREWVDSGGQKQYARFIEFRDRTTADKFRDLALAALDQFLEGQR